MTAYRCFGIGFDGHIRTADVLDCADDAAAADEARQLLQRHPAARQLEIWRLDRRVGVLTRQTLGAA